MFPVFYRIVLNGDDSNQHSSASASSSHLCVIPSELITSDSSEQQREEALKHVQHSAFNTSHAETTVSRAIQNISTSRAKYSMQ